MKLEKIIMGHNPLFGVDHLSQEQGNKKELKFEDKNLITDVLLYAKSLGVNAMMMSTHPRAATVVDIIKNNNELKDMTIYPLLPYIAKYVRQANEKGLLNLFMDVVGQTSLSQKFSIMLNSSRGILGKDLPSIVRLLVDIEFLPFKGLNIGAIFIHDALTDLGLGLGGEPMLEVFRDHVQKKYGVPAGFITKNVENFRSKVDARGWEDYLVMASLNKTGFYVNPSIEAAVKAVERPGMNFIAMSTLAGGALKPDDAYSFLGSVKGLKSVVVGMSRKEHILETVESINKHIK